MGNFRPGYIPIVIVIVISLLALAITGVGLYYRLQKEKQPVFFGEITNFTECAAAGYPVMESYPRRCAAGGQTFTEVIANGNINTNTFVNSNINMTTNTNTVVSSNTNNTLGVENELMASHEYIADQLKVGDKVARMTVAAISKKNPEIDLPLSLNIEVTFTGQETATGTYTYYKEADSVYNGNMVCFTDIDEKSRQYIPILQDDERYYFCFINQDFAREQFGPVGSTGIATVVIDNYIDIHFPSEGWNTAELVSVVSK